MDAAQHFYTNESRREFLKSTGLGIGALGLGSVLNQNLFASSATTRQPHFRPRAKHVIYSTWSARLRSLIYFRTNRS